MNKGRRTQGNAILASQTSADIIATPGSTARLVIKSLHVTHFKLAASSTFSITDGTTVYLKWDGTVIRDIGPINLGDGFYLPLNKALVLTVAGGNANVYAIATAEIQGA